MKIFGKSNFKPKDLELVISRIEDGKEEFTVFKAKTLEDLEAFDEILSRPNPPTRTKPDGTKTVMVDDIKYTEELTDWLTIRMDWMYIKSLEATEGLEWSRVKADDPDTFCEIHKELEESGLRPAEVIMIKNLVMEANVLTDDKIEEAKQRFLAFRQAERDSKSSQKVVPLNTGSGEVVSD